MELCEVVPAFKEEGDANLTWQDSVPDREGAWTFTRTGTTNRRPFPGLTAEERTRHKGELIDPNFFLSFSLDHVASLVLRPVDRRARASCAISSSIPTKRNGPTSIHPTRSTSGT